MDPCQSHSIGEIVWITRRQCQLESDPCEARVQHSDRRHWSTERKACVGGVDKESQTDDKTMHKSIEAGQKKASAQSAQSAASQTSQCIEATGAAQREQLGGAQDLTQGLAMGIFASSDRTRAALDVLCAACTNAERSSAAPQQQAPPDMQTGLSVYACLRREVPTHHEARSRAQQG